MIPDFDEHGYLPPGLHRASLDEIEDRFGRQSEIRRVQMASLRWLVDLAVRVGVYRLVINGSFVTDELEPNDVDCVLLPGPGFPRDPTPADELLEGMPFLDIQLVDQEAFDWLVTSFLLRIAISLTRG
jgi:hypothetical protein